MCEFPEFSGPHWQHCKREQTACDGGEETLCLACQMRLNRTCWGNCDECVCFDVHLVMSIYRRLAHTIKTSLRQTRDSGEVCRGVDGLFGVIDVSNAWTFLSQGHQRSDPSVNGTRAVQQQWLMAWNSYVTTCQIVFIPKYANIPKNLIKRWIKKKCFWSPIQILLPSVFERFLVPLRFLWYSYIYMEACFCHMIKNK